MDKLEGQLDKVNERLKAGHYGVRIEMRGSRLSLVATLPPKPGSKKNANHQQRIALGLRFHAEGLKQAEIKAKEVSVAIATDKFDWRQFIETEAKPEPKTIGEWIAITEQKYFKEINLSPKAGTTWKETYLKAFKKLPQNAELTEEILREVILKYDAASKTRKDLVLSYRLLCKVAGINADFSDIKCAYSRKELKPRDLPTDEQILDWYYRIKNPNWRFVYGLIATFGLRPHECFTCNLLDYHANPEQTYLEITESKTGYHTAFPFMPEWVELFCLKQGTLPKITAKSNVEFGRKVLHYLKGDARLPFAVYDLRHAWSVRTMILGLPVDVAASMMGHSVAIHTRTYQQWIKQSHQQKAFEDTLTKMQVLSNLSLPSSFNR